MTIVYFLTTIKRRAFILCYPFVAEGDVAMFCNECVWIVPGTWRD